DVQAVPGVAFELGRARWAKLHRRTRALDIPRALALDHFGNHTLVAPFEPDGFLQREEVAIGGHLTRAAQIPNGIGDPPMIARQVNRLAWEWHDRGRID